MKKYILDANIFIEAKNRYYGFDFCPGFWDWLVLPKNSIKLSSINDVKKELTSNKKDELAEWANRNEDFFEQSNIDRVAEINDRLMKGDRWDEKAVKDYLTNPPADLFIVGHALATNSIVVTKERPSGSTRNIKIPDVCQLFNIECVDIFDILRDKEAAQGGEKAQFILSSSTL